MSSRGELFFYVNATASFVEIVGNGEGQRGEEGELGNGVARVASRGRVRGAVRGVSLSRGSPRLPTRTAAAASEARRIRSI
jgi:hypothetical protein